MKDELAIYIKTSFDLEERFWATLHQVEEHTYDNNNVGWTAKL